MSEWLTPDWISAIGTLLQAIGIFASLAIAIIGFKNWQHEQLGRRRFEVAEEVLASMYEFQDTLEFMRNPLVQFSEAEVERLKKEGVPAERAQSVASYLQIFKRFESAKDSFEKLRAIQPRAKILLGVDIADAISQVWKIRAKLVVAAEELLDIARDGEDGIDREYKVNLRKTLYGRPQEQDEIAPLLAKAIPDYP